VAERRQIIRWEEPPPAQGGPPPGAPRTTRRRSVWDDVAAQLRAAPGSAAVIFEEPDTQRAVNRAAAMSGQIKAGLYPSFPRGEYGACTRVRDRKVTVYVWHRGLS
jgi:hypothetical protein